MRYKVRQAAGIAYDDAYPNHPTSDDPNQADERFVLADVKFNTMNSALQKNFITPILHPSGTAVLIPMPGELNRLVCEIRTNDVPSNPPKEFFDKMFEERYPHQGMEIVEMTWSSRFFVRYRLAEKYFVPHLPGVDVVGGKTGGVAIAGDAAHVHSPMGKSLLSPFRHTMADAEFQVDKA